MAIAPIAEPGGANPGDQLFLPHGEYQDRLVDYIHNHPDYIHPESRRNEVLGFFASRWATCAFPAR